jgi:tetratricopeptide (TPR) repeat protein
MSDARASYRKAFEHFKAGDRELAIAEFRHSLELDPEFALAWNGLSIALSQAGDLEGALEAGQKLVALEPDDPLSHVNLSRLFQRKGMVPEAEEELAIAAKLETEATS